MPSRLFTLLALLWAVPASALTPYTDDADIPHWADLPVSDLTQRSIIQGDPSGTFRPHATLNRAEAVTLLLRLTQLDDPTTTDQPTDALYTDVSTDQWFGPAVHTATLQGFVSGNPDGTFAPGRTLNRAEWGQMLANTLSLQPSSSPTPFTDVPLDAWFRDSALALAAEGLIREPSLQYSPQTPMTRAEVAWQLHQIVTQLEAISQLIAYDQADQSDALTKALAIRDTPTDTPPPADPAPDTPLSDSEYLKLIKYRYAIRPSNFEAEDQGHQSTARAVTATVSPADPVTPFPVSTPDPDSWHPIGTIDVSNEYDQEVSAQNFYLEFKFDHTNVFPADSFSLRLTAPGQAPEVRPVPRGGTVLFSGTTLRLPAETTQTLTLEAQFSAPTTLSPANTTLRVRLRDADASDLIFTEDGYLFRGLRFSVATHDFPPVPLSFEE